MNTRTSAGKKFTLQYLFANRFQNKDAEIETRLPFKAWETQFMWLRVYIFGNFSVCPG